MFICRKLGTLRRSIACRHERAAVALRVLTCERWKWGEGRRVGGAFVGVLGLRKNTGWCPGKGWEDVAVPVHRNIKACLKKTLNPFKTLNCEHYF